MKDGLAVDCKSPREAIQLILSLRLTITKDELILFILSSPSFEGCILKTPCTWFDQGLDYANRRHNRFKIHQGFRLVKLGFINLTLVNLPFVNLP